MIRKESLKYRDVCEYEGKFYDWKAGEHLLQKGMVVDEMFHPLEHDIVFEKDLQVTLRDGVKILTDVYLPADTDEPLPAIIAWSPYGKNSGNADLVRKHLEFLDTPSRYSGLSPEKLCRQRRLARHHRHPQCQQDSDRSHHPRRHLHHRMLQRSD